MADLFTPLRLGSLELPNRIWMAPLTRCRACHPLLNGGAQPVGPSPIAITGDEVHTPEGKKPNVVPRELRDDELPALVQGFR